MSTLEQLQAWYARQCNGIWEHSFGVHIESTDNPGWWVKINLQGTSLQAIAFAEIAEGVDAQRHQLGPNWFCCHVEDGIWHGAGDAGMLDRILKTFLSWADTNGV